MLEPFYPAQASAFVNRARKLADADDAASLIYAALEIRMGVEARLQSYVHAHQEISRQIKNGWRIKDLAAGIEKRFKESNLVAELKIIDTNDKAELARLCYIPVSKKLKGIAEKLGDFLHYREYKVDRNREWWLKLRENVDSGLSALNVCAQATMLGPPLWKPGSGQIDLKLELPSRDPRLPLMQDLAKTGQHHTIGIQYIDVDEFYAQHER